jgi:choice-of-anchor B domain-containing protein
MSLLAHSQDFRNVVLLDHWFDSTVTLGVEDARLSDVWGFRFEGELYTAVGTTEGISFFQIKDDELVHVDDKAGAFQGFSVVHRDMKTYKNYLYAVGDEGTATLQIFDLSYLPDSVSKVYDSNAFFAVCHNIYIDTATAKLYAAGANNVGMKVLDISNPVNPVLLHDFNDVNYVHDCFVKNDTAFLNCGIDGLWIYNFSGPVPIQLGILDFYADQGYNHSGWMTPDGSKYAFCDETLGTRIKLCELSDLTQIKVDESFASSDYQDYMPHNIYLTNTLAFVSYYNQGLRIFDIASAPIREIGHYDTFFQETSYKLNGAWGVFVFEEEEKILISDRQNGLFLFSFPIQVFENGVESTSVYASPIIDENSILLPRSHFNNNDLTFTIADLSGRLVYYQESFLNWVNIPLQLSAGAYVFGIFDEEGELLESGKFVKAN